MIDSGLFVPASHYAKVDNLRVIDERASDTLFHSPNQLEIFELKRGVKTISVKLLISKATFSNVAYISSFDIYGEYYRNIKKNECNKGFIINHMVFLALSCLI